jgi:dGTPase
VVECLEKNGEGLNLTWEVRDGILNHKTSLSPATLEGDIVRLSDKIAYISHDIDDGIRAGVLSEDTLPQSTTNILGHSTRDRLDTMIHNVVDNSAESPRAKMSEDCWNALMELRQYMFEMLYTNPVVKKEETKAYEIIKILYERFMESPELVPDEFKKEGLELSTAVTDYIACMTDNYAVGQFQNIYIPQSWMSY